MASQSVIVAYVRSS